MDFELFCRQIHEVRNSETRDGEDILCSIIDEVISERELVEAFYFLTLRLEPDFYGVVVGVAEKTLIEAIAQDTNKHPTEVLDILKSAGNFDSCFPKLARKQPKKSITLSGVMEMLKSISTEGENKLELLTEILSELGIYGKREVVRFLSKGFSIRLGEESLTKLIATVLWEKYKRGSLADYVYQFERNLNIFPRYDKVLTKYLDRPDEVHTFKAGPGVPVNSMRVMKILSRKHKLKALCKNGEQYMVEIKYDGFRCEIHKIGKKIKLFSKNSLPLTSEFPDLVATLEEYFEALPFKNLVLDAEAVPIDLTADLILPFSYIAEHKECSVSICLFLFDVLVLDKVECLDLHERDRRALLEKHFPDSELVRKTLVLEKCIESEYINADLIEKFVNSAIKYRCEGIVLKELNSKYEAGTKSTKWLAVKRGYTEKEAGDTLDLVIIGANYGTGKYGGLFASFLVACFDEQTMQLETVCKIGTGFSESDIVELSSLLEGLICVQVESIERGKEKCDQWVSPNIVIEVAVAEFTFSPVYTACYNVFNNQRGVSIRSPRFVRVREDKQIKTLSDFENLSTTAQIEQMVESELKKQV